MKELYGKWKMEKRIFFFRFSKIFFRKNLYLKIEWGTVQNFPIIGQGVPEIRGVDGQSQSRIYYIDFFLPMVSNWAPF